MLHSGARALGCLLSWAAETAPNVAVSAPKSEADLSTAAFVLPAIRVNFLGVTHASSNPDQSQDLLLATESRLLQHFEATCPEVVYEERRNRKLTIEQLYWIERIQVREIRKVFLDGVPDSPEQFTEPQIECLLKHRAPKVAFALGFVSEVRPLIPPELQLKRIQLSKMDDATLQLLIKSNPEVESIVFTQTETAAAHTVWIDCIAERFEGPVDIVMGGDHELDYAFAECSATFPSSVPILLNKIEMSPEEPRLELVPWGHYESKYADRPGQAVNVGLAYYCTQLKRMPELERNQRFQAYVQELICYAREHDVSIPPDKVAFLEQHRK